MPGITALTEAVARYYFKLLAIKDEYEVARLYAETDFVERVAAQFEGDYKLNVPPRAADLQQAGSGDRRAEEARVRPVDDEGVRRAREAAQGLRGTALDVFGKTAERRSRARADRRVRDADRGAARASSRRTITRSAVELARIPELHPRLRSRQGRGTSPRRSSRKRRCSSVSARRSRRRCRRWWRWLHNDAQPWRRPRERGAASQRSRSRRVRLTERYPYMSFKSPLASFQSARRSPLAARRTALRRNLRRRRRSRAAAAEERGRDVLRHERRRSVPLPRGREGPGRRGVDEGAGRRRDRDPREAARARSAARAHQGDRVEGRGPDRPRRARGERPLLLPEARPGRQPVPARVSRHARTVRTG